jgi:ribosome-associated protein
MLRTCCRQPEAITAMAPPDEPLVIRPGLVIPAEEIEERFSTSGGPGGQHANRARTRVELRFDIATSPTLTDAQRSTLLARVGPELRVVVDEERSQLRNRVIARQRLGDRLRVALTPRRRRRATQPTRASRVRRLDAKRRRGDLKRGRRPPQDG